MARAQDISQFDGFYRREFPRLAGSLRIVCGDESVAEELAQEAFTRALNHWDRLGEWERPAGWVYRTGFNLLRTYWAKSKRSEDPLVREPFVPPAESQIDLVRLLGQLPLKQRQAVVLRHILDHSTDEAAEILGVSPGALRMTLHRAIENLRELSGIEIDEEST